ncbi:uncharacterized protein LOC123540886 [Mercenaria mercenaria]|uniref:uncharacterized protein LOC123540886 n=1 Tax=Mercenaria mercenaria TaxID=6596 RepID=UPI00234E5DCF|nr:uncharacterized protein LOC123540886 [Mercenaria mercenaria]
MVVAVRVSPPVKGKVPKLNMLELVSVANNRYKTSKLRRRLLPQGYCYVCSRLDPSGIFRKQNGHLYKTGYLHTCEHFPKAPYTTFVQEEIPIQDDDGGDSLADLALDKTETIRVTIRRGSRSTGSRSTLKTDDKFEHSLNKFDEDQQSSAESLFKEKLPDHSTGRFRLPSLAGGVEGGLSARFEANRLTARKLNIFRKSHGAQTGSSRKLMLQTESLHTGSEPNTTRDYVTTKPSDSNQTSARSIFTEGAVTSKSARTADLDSLFVSSGRSLAKKQSAISMNSGLELPVTHGVFINQSDGLQNAFTTEPLIREEIMIEEIREPARRLKARFQRERKPQERHAPSEHSISTYRPDSGHLRYHHRMTEDSVPDPGFEIPPTPSEDVSDLEKLKVEQEDGFDKDAVKDAIKGGVNGEVEHNISENMDIPTTLSGIPSERRSFCRCATDLREISFTKNICRTCGKDCKLRSSSSRGSSHTYSQSGTSAMTTRSGRFRSTKLQMSKEDEMAMYRMNARTNAAKNKDFVDHGSKIIHEYDDEYWSSDEEFADLDNSPVSWLRNNKPYPLLNPDIHKQVYIDALQAAKMKGKKNTEDFEIDELKMLRRPNVFSYIPLLPYKDKQKIRYIGIRPDDSSKPKKGQFMKHIFGDVRLDDFYPSAKPSKGGKIIIDDLVKTSSTEHMSSKESQVPATSRGPERSSISLKMKSRGISFDNEG